MIREKARTDTGNISSSDIIPTKVDLLQQGLVVIDRNHKQVTTNTLIVTKQFNKKHKNVLQRITNLTKKGRLKIQPSYYLDKQGKKQKYYVLDRKSFSIVVLGFTGEEAENFRVEYIEQFEKIADELLEWRKTRQDVIEPTKVANDSLAWLKLALEKEIPESRKPKFLYINIQQAITKAATGKANSERSEMSAEQLKIIQWLEVQVHDEIERLKGVGIPATSIREQILALLKGE